MTRRLFTGTRLGPIAIVGALSAFALLVGAVLPALAQRQPNAAFRRVSEPRAGAFSLLVPEEWAVQEGAVADTAGASAPADFTARRDELGSVMLRLLPGGAGAGVGSGEPDAALYLIETVLRELRPRAINLRVVERRREPALARDGDAAVVSVTYAEDGTSFRERLFTVLEREAAPAGGWRCRGALALRAPAADWKQWEPVLSLMLVSAIPRSGLFDPAVRDALRLALPGENDWLDPFGGDPEPGAFHFGRYRWRTPAGDVVFSFNETYNPNVGRLLGRDDWRKSKPL